MADVLKPSGSPSEVVEGPGDLRLSLGACEMVFSAEDVGWQVWFEGETAGYDTDALIAQVALQVEAFVGANIEWVRYD